MNDRIKELAKQADCTIDGMGFGEGNVEKFAELIIRECAEVGLDSVEDGDDVDAIMKRVRNNILKHFGVKA